MASSRSADQATRTTTCLSAAVAAGVLAVLLIFRNLALSSPIMSGDEYAYFALSHFIRNVPALAAADPYLQRVFDPLYLGLGAVFFRLGTAPESLMKVFNALAFSLGVLLSSLLMYRLSSDRIPLYAPILIALLPFSAYTAYFMPETMYFVLFVLIAVNLALLVPVRLFLGSAVSGILVAGLALTKAHGGSIFLAVFAALFSLRALPLTIRPSLKRILVAVGIFVGTAYLAEISLSALVTGVFSASPFLFIGGQFYQPFMSTLLEGAPLSGSYLALAVNVLGHLVTFLFVGTGAVASCIGWIRTLYDSRPPQGGSPALPEIGIFALLAFTFSATLFAVAMTVAFTDFAGQFDVINGRYYAFILVLYLPLFFITAGSRRTSTQPFGGWRLWGAIGLAASAMMFWVQRHFSLYPWDYPDLFSASLWRSSSLLALPTLLVGVVSYTAITFRPKLQVPIYSLFLFVLFLSSQSLVIRWQFDQSQATAPLAEEGRALRALVPADERDRGTIIGDDRYLRMAYFLFGYSSNPAVRVYPQGTTVNTSMIAQGSTWVVLLGNYNVLLPSQSSLSTNDMTFAWLRPGIPAIHEQVSVWDGRPLSYTFGQGGDTALLQQFNPPQAWGAWSASDGARIILPLLLSGRVEVRLTGWIVPPRASQQVTLVFGDVSVPMQLHTTKGQACQVVEIPTPVQAISIHGITPYQEHPWTQAQAVALVQLDIQRADSTDAVACPPYLPLQ